VEQIENFEISESQEIENAATTLMKIFHSQDDDEKKKK